MKGKHFHQAWINNVSIPKSPLLTLTITLKEEDYKKNPIHVVQSDDETKEQHTLVLSFLTPEDLDLLEKAIIIARQGGYENETMVKIWNEQHVKDVLYFVTTFKDGQEQGGIYGPNSRLDDMLDVDPEVLMSKEDIKANDIYIMRINKEAVEEEEKFTEMFIWNKTLGKWQEA